MNFWQFPPGRLELRWATGEVAFVELRDSPKAHEYQVKFWARQKMLPNLSGKVPP